MPIALRIEHGQGYSAAAPAEWQVIMATAGGWVGNKPPLIYFHGYGQDATTAATEAEQRALILELAQHYSVIVADLGLNAFGNSTHRARTVEAKAFQTARTAASGPVTLVGTSMGALGALGYTLDHPELVSAVAVIVPALDLADLTTRGYSTPINAAYPPSYNDATDGPTHSPVQFAGDLDADLPIHLWTSSNDDIAVPATADAFIAARPQTERTDLGAQGHGGVSVAAPLVVDWLRSL